MQTLDLLLRRIDKVVRSAAAVEVDMAQDAGAHQTVERAVDGRSVHAVVVLGNQREHVLGRQMLLAGSEDVSEDGDSRLRHALADTPEQPGGLRSLLGVVDRRTHPTSVLLRNGRLRSRAAWLG
jgi:hypothetical protein